MLQIFAMEQNEQDMAKRLQLTKSDVERTKEQVLSASVDILLSYAEENLAALAEYGVTAEQIIEIGTTLEDFMGLIRQPRTILNQKYVALSSLGDTDIAAQAFHLLDKRFPSVTYS